MQTSFPHRHLHHQFLRPASSGLFVCAEGHWVLLRLKRPFADGSTFVQFTYEDFRVNSSTEVPFFLLPTTYINLANLYPLVRSTSLFHPLHIAVIPGYKSPFRSKTPPSFAIHLMTCEILGGCLGGDFLYVFRYSTCHSSSLYIITIRADKDEAIPNLRL